MTTAIATAGNAAGPQPAVARAGWARQAVGLPEARWALAATALFAAGGLAQLAGAPPAVWWLLYLACYAAGGWEPAVAGGRALRAGTLDVDLLMVVAAVLAASIGQVLDGALLIVIFATSGALEAVATARTADSVRALLTLAPETATRLRPEGGEELVEAASLAVGDRVLVRPGERVAADGLVDEGVSEVDEAGITGEPLPALKQPASHVFAGTLNGTGALTVRVTREAADSAVARIVALVEEASATKATAQLFIEKVEQRYSVAMVLVTLALLTVPLALGAAFQPTLLRAMTFMIVASPCAVVLATMPPLLAAIANAGRHGLLVKSAPVMERIGTVDLVAFDKTGTLTEGTPRVVAVRPLAPSGLSENALLRLAAAAERSSEHPLARAVARAADERGIGLPEATGFRATPGQGVRAVVDGHDVTVGSAAVLAHGAPRAVRDAATAAAAQVESHGQTALHLVVDGVPLAVIAVADRLRNEARATVGRLAGTTGRPPVLLTGDAALPARAVAEAAGITSVHARLLPAHKAEHLREAQSAGATAMFVGDGINDAPALATADVGVAMGRHGSDLALQTADAVIVRDDLSTLPAVVALSRRARRVVVANLVIAGTFIVALSTWDLVGHLPLPLGVAGHEGSTVIVALNGLRLLRSSSWQEAAGEESRR
ncbi:heavy metal translocating P-type ATPase [Motilibacter aurantiacus]|uniref:heavy metal translocating P-type ATPase n=1 Tax=Motilibacter aurantiacus TaxID=2714955 RepID=UPI00140E783A|nr:heavy metal translocating P-type ATPase [Motilibacter aurantiacus]NHC47499.1 heavy metal translocating P-type ATPase [Motilibacter aurantiacus]